VGQGKIIIDSGKKQHDVDKDRQGLTVRALQVLNDAYLRQAGRAP
jgi:hypothetical protein